MNEELLSRITLNLIPGIGHLLARHLVVYAGGAKELFQFKKPELLQIQGLGDVVASHILQHKKYRVRAEDEMRFIEREKIQMIFFDDPAYPYRLNECSDPPFVLFYKGSQSLNANRFISIVGTRKATSYGKNFLESFCQELKQYNVVVVSGLAYGIDIHSHRESLKNNMATIGVVAHGLDRIYPYAHKSTAEKMKENGGLLTEFFCHTNPDRENFPKRNRIIAGMSDATILIEAAEKGGALITGNLAFDYGREVMALPGRSFDNYSKGCNNLIKRHKASLITNIEDVIHIMGWEQQEKAEQLNIFDQMTEDEKKVMEFVRGGCTFVQDLTIRLQKSFAEVQSILFEMEMSGWLKQLPGNRVEIKF
jgi:DNA processing protein